MLDLLHDRVRATVDERITGQQQDRQAVGMGNAGGSDHVQRAGTD